MAAEGSLSHEEAGPDDVQALPLLRVHESYYGLDRPLQSLPQQSFLLSASKKGNASPLNATTRSSHHLTVQAQRSKCPHMLSPFLSSLLPPASPTLSLDLQLHSSLGAGAQVEK